MFVSPGKCVRKMKHTRVQDNQGDEDSCKILRRGLLSPVIAGAEMLRRCQDSFFPNIVQNCKGTIKACCPLRLVQTDQEARPAISRMLTASYEENECSLNYTRTCKAT